MRASFASPLARRRPQGISEPPPPVGLGRQYTTSRCHTGYGTVSFPPLPQPKITVAHHGAQRDIPPVRADPCSRPRDDALAGHFFQRKMRAAALIRTIARTNFAERSNPQRRDHAPGNPDPLCHALGWLLELDPELRQARRVGKER